MNIRIFFAIIAGCFLTFSLNTQAMNESEKCRFFNGKPGSCRYGDECRYLHIRETPDQYRQRKEQKESDYLRRQEVKQKKQEDYWKRQELKQKKQEDYVRRQTLKQTREEESKKIRRRGYRRHDSAGRSGSSEFSSSSGSGSFSHPRKSPYKNVGIYTNGSSSTSTNGAYHQDIGSYCTSRSGATYQDLGNGFTSISNSLGGNWIRRPDGTDFD